MIILGLKLLLAHVIGDFVFHPDKWVENKQAHKHKSAYLYLHLLIHALALCLLLEFDFSYWGAVLSILVSHLLIDLVKLHLSECYSPRLLFFADQLAHLFIIAGVVYYYEPYALSIDEIISPQVLLLALALLAVGPVSAISMKIILTYWNLEENDSAQDSLKNAGKYIGMLERLLVFVLIVLNQWSAIGFLITAKSVLRFSDISKAKDRKLTEYILIGTLLSFGLATLIGLCYIRLKTIILQ